MPDYSQENCYNFKNEIKSQFTANTTMQVSRKVGTLRLGSRMWHPIREPHYHAIRAVRDYIWNGIINSLWLCLLIEWVNIRGGYDQIDQVRSIAYYLSLSLLYDRPPNHGKVRYPATAQNRDPAPEKASAPQKTPLPQLQTQPWSATTRAATGQWSTCQLGIVPNYKSFPNKRSPAVR